MDGRRYSIGILQIFNSKETSFVTQSEEAVALLVAIEANLVDLQLIDAVGGRESPLFVFGRRCVRLIGNKY